MLFYHRVIGGFPYEVPMPNPAHTLVSACHKCRSIRLHWLTTCYWLHQKTSLVSIWPRTRRHVARLTQGTPACDTHPTVASRPSIRSFTWWGLDTSSWSSSRLLDRSTPQWHWIYSCQPLETGHFTGPWWSSATTWAGFAVTTTMMMAYFVIVYVLLWKL